MIKYFISVLACLNLLNACTDKNPIIEPAKMQSILWDVIQLEAYSQLIIAPDTVKMDVKKNALLQQKIFLLHRVSKEQYFRSYQYYSTHPEMMRIIFDSITTKADRDRSKIMEKRYGKSTL